MPVRVNLSVRAPTDLSRVEAQRRAAESSFGPPSRDLAVRHGPSRTPNPDSSAESTATAAAGMTIAVVHNLGKGCASDASTPDM